MSALVLIAWMLLGFVLGFSLAQTVYRKLMNGYAEICADYRTMVNEMLAERDQ